MPVTAKLSRKFYEKLGDDIANELVEWFNLVDATYRADLRELNDRNFALFDAKLEQRLAELKAELKTEFSGRIGELRAEMLVGFARMDEKFAQLETRLTRRMFAFWIAQSATTVGLIFGIVKILQH
ncbi:MAG TPA: hypothetical protein VH542_00610 [Steroidobacteraceae bacterium]